MAHKQPLRTSGLQIKGLPFDLLRNKRTGEEGRAVGRRTWRRRRRRISMIDVRVDTGGSYVFKTWVERNCVVLVGQGSYAPR